MDSRHEALFTPLKIGGTTIKNRFILCAMEGTNLIDGMGVYKFNEHCRDFYLERAESGVALMIPGMVPIKSFVGGKWLYQCERIFMGPVKELMDEIHARDSKLFLQIGAGIGRSLATLPVLVKMYRSKPMRVLGKLAGMDAGKLFDAPSAGLPNVWDPEIKTSEMSAADIEAIIAAYGKTALLCKRAGIDGVEIHAVHEGYLLDQFAMSATNKRKDEYGGSLENRMRFACRIIRSIKEACGEDYPVSVRYSVESKMIGFNVGAVPGEAYEEFGRGRKESAAAARLLEAAGADLLDADNGSYDSWYWAHPPMYMPLGCNLDDAAFIKKQVGIPVACAGRMEDPDMAARAIAEGRIDGVAIGRQLLCDGAYVAKVRDGALGDIRPCIACHNGCFGLYRYKGLPAQMPESPLGRCALNPATFSEAQYAIRPAPAAKRVAVIGGGIGGMEVARLAALRGHRVTLYEKSGELGGAFIAAAAPSFKEKDKMLLEWYRRQVAALPIELRMNTELKSEDLASLEADEVIVATGAKPRRLPIPGADRENVMEAIDYLRGRKPVGERVVVVGGGLTGCEIAYDLVLKGKKPVIVEMQDDILKIKDLSAANSNMLRDLVRYHKIPVELQAKVTGIGAEGVSVETPSGARIIPADSVVVSAGYVAGSVLAQKDEGKLHIVGDAAKVGNLRHVIKKAYEVAFAI
jgi:NADH:flavin oxidoreductases, Old Yellow Enzyme family